MRKFTVERLKRMALRPPQALKPAPFAGPPTRVVFWTPSWTYIGRPAKWAYDRYLNEMLNVHNSFTAEFDRKQVIAAEANYRGFERNRMQEKLQYYYHPFGLKHAPATLFSATHMLRVIAVAGQRVYSTYTDEQLKKELAINNIAGYVAWLENNQIAGVKL